MFWNRVKTTEEEAVANYRKALRDLIKADAVLRNMNINAELSHKTLFNGRQYCFARNLECLNITRTNTKYEKF